MPKFEEFIKGFDEEDTPEYDYPFEERDLNPRDTPRKAKLLAQAKYAYNKTNDKDLAGKLFDEYLGGNYAKARKLVDLGEEPFGTHKFFYNKGGKYYSTGFNNDEDKEVSVDEMAKIYDDYIAKQKK